MIEGFHVKKSPCRTYRSLFQDRPFPICVAGVFFESCVTACYARVYFASFLYKPPIFLFRNGLHYCGPTVVGAGGAYPLSSKYLPSDSRCLLLLHIYISCVLCVCLQIMTSLSSGREPLVASSPANWLDVKAARSSSLKRVATTTIQTSRIYLDTSTFPALATTALCNGASEPRLKSSREPAER